MERSEVGLERMRSCSDSRCSDQGVTARCNGKVLAVVRNGPTRRQGRRRVRGSRGSNRECAPAGVTA
eukprot:7360786-Prymnesium_polylepis.1